MFFLLFIPSFRIPPSHSVAHAIRKNVLPVIPLFRNVPNPIFRLVSLLSYHHSSCTFVFFSLLCFTFSVTCCVSYYPCVSLRSSARLSHSSSTCHVPSSYLKYESMFAICPDCLLLFTFCLFHLTRVFFFISLFPVFICRVFVFCFFLSLFHSFRILFCSFPSIYSIASFAESVVSLLDIGSHRSKKRLFYSKVNKYDMVHSVMIYCFCLN